MGYRRALLLRWSRRDRLAVLVVAVTVAFLVGTTLLVLAAGAQTTAIAAEYDAPGVATTHASPDAARAAAPDDAVVLPIAEATGADGTSRYVVGRPAASDAAAEFGLAGEGTSVGALDEPATLTLDGDRGAVSVDATPRDGSILPPPWVLTDAGTVDRLGPSGAIAIRPEAGSPDRGVPLRSALAFFVLGIGQALSTLSVAALGAGLLVAVTVYSVTRMSVRDRTTAIRVLRSTGATPRTILGLFGLRAAALSGLGVALGYAIGVILPSAAASIAVAAGLPTSLDVRVTADAARAIAPLLAGVLVVGGVAGVLAALPAVRDPPGRLTGPGVRTDPETGSILGAASRAGTTLLGWRALVPTAATLTAFVLFAVLVVTAAGVVGPLASADATTVTAPDAPHPFAGSVPEAYADAIRAQGEAASPEVLLLSAVDGQPFVARGARFDAFASVTPASIERGRAHDGPDEAVIGADLATTLGVSPGDRLTLGGSTHAGIARVRIVGTYAAPGPFDDQLLVPLPTARHLADRPAGRVHVVRSSGLPDDVAPDAADGGVVDVSVPRRALANGSADVAVTLRNDGPDDRDYDLPVRFDGEAQRLRGTLSPGERRTETVTLDVGPAGTGTLRVGDRDYELRVVDPDAIEVRLPDRAPPGSEPLVEVTTASGAPANATVSVANRSVRTDPEGRARVRLDAPGTHTVTADSGDHVATATIAVENGAPRALDARLAISPSDPTLFVRPTARLTLDNPWNGSREGVVTIDGPGGRHEEAVSLSPGGDATVATTIDRQPPGTYSVVASVDGREVAATSYEVTGDERIAAALASSGRTGGSAIGRAIETAFGNLQLVLGAVLALAGLMAAGGSTAVFAAAVHARQRTVGVYRATGAGPLRLFRIVLRDALLVGTVATAIALVVGLAVLRALAAAGRLVVFGVALSPSPSPTVLVGIALGALGLTLLGAAVALAGLVVRSPAALLDGDRSYGVEDRG